VYGVIGADELYTVSVRISVGNGTLSLDVIDDDSILDSESFSLGGTGTGNGDFDSGESYTVFEYSYIYLPMMKK